MAVGGAVFVRINIVFVYEEIVDGFCRVNVPVQRAGESYAEYEAQDAFDKYYKRVQLQHLCGVFAYLNAEYLCDRYGDFLAAVLAEPFLAQQH